MFETPSSAEREGWIAKEALTKESVAALTTPLRKEGWKFMGMKLWNEIV